MRYSLVTDGRTDRQCGALVIGSRFTVQNPENEMGCQTLGKHGLKKLSTIRFISLENNILEI